MKNYSPLKLMLKYHYDRDLMFMFLGLFVVELVLYLFVRYIL